jgi:hypothetical protein
MLNPGLAKAFLQIVILDNSFSTEGRTIEPETKILGSIGLCWMLSCGRYRPVVRIWIDVSKEYIASILGGDNQPKKTRGWTTWLGRILLVCYSAEFRPWRWRWYVPPKRRFTYELQGATTVKTSNYTQECVICYYIPFKSTITCSYKYHIFPWGQLFYGLVRHGTFLCCGVFKTSRNFDLVCTWTIYFT